MKPTKSQIVRPSGIVQSKDGRFYFWECTKTGTKTFANQKRFDNVLKKYGTEENLFKTFVCKAAQSSPSQTVAKASVNVEEGDCTVAVVENVVKKASLKKTTKVAKEEVKEIYPWQKESNFFGGNNDGKLLTYSMDVAESTKDACAYPCCHLDHMCQGCKVYDKCVLSLKLGPDDWNNPKNRNRGEVKIKRMIFDDPTT